MSDRADPDHPLHRWITETFADRDPIIELASRSTLHMQIFLLLQLAFWPAPPPSPPQLDHLARTAASMLADTPAHRVQPVLLNLLADLPVHPHRLADIVHVISRLHSRA